MKFFSKHAQAMFIMVALFLVSGLMLQSQGGNQRVDNFLRSLSAFPNMDSARTAFQAAKFTETERTLMQNELKKQIYKPQLTRLAATVAKMPKPPKPPMKSVQLLQLEQKKASDAVNARNTIEVSRFLALSAKVAEGSALQTVIGKAPKITSLSDVAIRPGMNRIIRGTNFGPQGTVTFTFGSASFNGIVETWTNDLILVTLPSTVQGLPETDGNVTVRKQNSVLRADAPIRFIPLYEFEHTRSTAMRNQEPYHAEVYFILCLLGQFNVPFCSKYDIYFPDCPSYNFKNGAVIEQLIYESDVWLDWDDDESVDYYIGWDGLPKWTTGRLCEHGLEPGAIYCEVSIKYPRGLSWN
jgi:hypothetical protein